MSTCKHITDNLAPCGRDTHTGSRFCDEHGGMSKEEAEYKNCKTCGKLFRLNANPFAVCLAIHPEGTCCHYNDTEIPAAEIEAIRQDWKGFAKPEHVYVGWLDEMLREFASEAAKWGLALALVKTTSAINARFEAALGEDDPEANEPGSITEAGIKLKFGGASHNTLRKKARNRWYGENNNAK